MDRLPEPELMTDPAQASAYAEADFSEAHERFAELLVDRLAPIPELGRALDLGCGDADVTTRVARRLPPLWEIDGLDGSEAMLDHGRRALRDAGLEERVRLTQARLPGDAPPRAPYPLVFSNSLLHHLEAPSVLWETIIRASAPGSAFFVMDLARPADAVQAARLVELHAADAPAILRRDFYNSLLAAYRIEEIAEQLAGAGLSEVQLESVSDRHWIAWRAAMPPHRRA